MATYPSFSICRGCRQSSKSTKEPASWQRGGARASAGTSYQQPTALEFSRILGVSPNASKVEVKTAYRRLALQFHPDVCKDNECDTRFMEVNRAYESLMTIASCSNCSNATAGDSFSNRSQWASMHYGFHEAAEPATSGADQDDDPWADFLQSLVKGTYEDQLRGDSSSSNSRHTSTATRPSSCEGAW
jgi:DnaJ-class molecular chaperone